MQILNKRPGDQLKLGRKGEYNARRIALDLTAWRERYGPDALWSSQNIVNHLCASFQESGAKVTCHPLAGSPLNVTIHISAKPMIPGTPAPDNPVPLGGWSSVSLKQTSETDSSTTTVRLGRTVHGGTLDCSTGLLTVTHKNLYFTGSEDWQTRNDGSGYRIFLPISDILPNPNGDLRTNETCSHYPFLSSNDVANLTMGICSTSDGVEIYDPNYDQEDVTAWKAYLDQLRSEGGALQVVILLNEPITTQLEVPQITAAAGANSLQCAAGEVTVSGKTDFRYELQQLKDAIQALQN